MSVDLVETQEFLRPQDLVSDTLALRLRRGPQFEVAQSVVVSDAVFVVNLFLGEQPPSKAEGHHNMVLVCPTAAEIAQSAESDLDLDVAERPSSPCPNGTDSGLRSDGNISLHASCPEFPRVMRTAHSGDGRRPFASIGCAHGAVVRRYPDRYFSPNIAVSMKSVIVGSTIPTISLAPAVSDDAYPIGVPWASNERRVCPYVSVFREPTVVSATQPTTCDWSFAAKNRARVHGASYRFVGDF